LFHLATRHPQSIPEGEHEPIRVVSLCSLGESVGSRLTLGMSIPVHICLAGLCSVTTACGHAATSRNGFELPLLRHHQLASSLRWFQKGTIAQGRPSRSFLRVTVNAASLKIVFVATSAL